MNQKKIIGIVSISVFFSLCFFCVAIGLLLRGWTLGPSDDPTKRTVVINDIVGVYEYESNVGNKEVRLAIFEITANGRFTLTNSVKFSGYGLITIDEKNFLNMDFENIRVSYTHFWNIVDEEGGGYNIYGGDDTDPDHWHRFKKIK